MVCEIYINKFIIRKIRKRVEYGLKGWIFFIFPLKVYCDCFSIRKKVNI